MHTMPLHASNTCRKGKDDALWRTLPGEDGVWLQPFARASFERPAGAQKSRRMEHPAAMLTEVGETKGGSTPFTLATHGHPVRLSK